MHQMVTGRLPFSAEHDVAMVRAIATETPTPLRATRPDAPEALEPIVARALQKEPADRYASAGALLQDLVALSPTPATRAGTAVMIGAGAPDPARRIWCPAWAVPGPKPAFMCQVRRRE